MTKLLTLVMMAALTAGALGCGDASKSNTAPGDKAPSTVDPMPPANPPPAK